MPIEKSGGVRPYGESVMLVIVSVGSVDQKPTNGSDFENSSTIASPFESSMRISPLKNVPSSLRSRKLPPTPWSPLPSSPGFPPKSRRSEAPLAVA